MILARRLASIARRSMDGFLRLAGAEPARTLCLARGMTRAARGRLALIEDRRESGVPAELVPLLIGAVLSLLSLVLTALTIVIRSRPEGTAFGIAAAALAVSVVGGCAGMVAMMQEDDRLATGWWPLSERDRAAARLLCTLRPVLQACAVLCALPALAFAVVAPIPVLPAILLAGAVVLQAIAVVSFMLALAAAASRILGRDRARRLIPVIAVAGMLPLALAGPLSGTIVRSLAAGSLPLPLALRWSPPGWFAAWATLPFDRGALLPAALGAGAALVLAPLALRLLSSASPASAEPQHARVAPRPSPLSALLRAALAPHGREGRSLRLVVLAHARQEWRLVLLRALPLLPAIAVAAVAALPADIVDSLVRPLPAPFPMRPILGACTAALFAGVPAVLLLLASEAPAAAWLLAQSSLAPARMAEAMLAAGRALVLLPILALMAALHVAAGSSPLIAIPDLCVAALLFEIVAAAVIARHRAWPFSLARGGPPDELVLGLLVGCVPVSLMLSLALTMIYDRNAVTRVAVVILLGAAAWAMRRHLRRECIVHGLRLEIAPPP